MIYNLGAQNFFLSLLLDPNQRSISFNSLNSVEDSGAGV